MEVFYVGELRSLDVLLLYACVDFLLGKALVRSLPINL